MAGKFAIGLRSVPGAQIELVASRSAERAAAFAAQLGVAKSVQGYEAAAAADIDAVYIATPPSEHRDNALMFIAAGKAVLMEKPMAASTADAEAIFAAARSARVFCMEGMWTRFLPAMALARRLIAEGRIGEPKALTASFATAAVVDGADSLFRADLGGGALGHRGIYPIALALDLLGPATLAGAAVSWGQTQVDEEAMAVLRHEGGALSSIHAGARTQAANSLEVLGTQGTLRFLGPIYRPFGVAIAPVTARRRGERAWTRGSIFREGGLAQGLNQRLEGLRSTLAGRRSVTTHAPYIGNGYPHEAMAAMEAIDAGRLEHPLSTHASTLAALRLVDAIRQSRTIGDQP